MKRITLLIPSLLLLAMLSACVPVETAPAPEPMSEEAAVDAVASQEITHETGTTTIEGVPERIVVLEYSFADNLGTLSVAPVGYAVDSMPDYLLPFTAEVGAEEVGTRAEPSLETIAALSPDLIIGDSRRHTEIYDKLSEIAPTVIFNSLRGSYQDQLDTFQLIAQILDKEAEAADLLSTYEETFAATVGETNPDAGEFVIGVLWSGGYTAHSNESFMGSFMESLGRTNALSPQDGETQYVLELEGLASINPSTIVILCAPSDQAVFDELQAQPVWQSIDAAQNNQVYLFDRNLWSKGRGVMAYEAILQDAVDSGLLAETESTTGMACP
ncbi:MAG: ABC transporter substrate-binding protein [Chloroflexota bacterium]